jgi:glycosyltransferase involved in cell wall biosynthesis
MRIDFIVPTPFDILTGGNQYDRHMADQWRLAGHSVDIHVLPGRSPVPDELALSSAGDLLRMLPTDAVVVMDNLVLAAFENQADALAKRPLVILDHHPTGLETGLDPQTSDRLIAIERRMLALARHVVVTSVTTASTLKADFGVEANRLTIIEPGTEPAPRSVGSGRPTINILSIGSLIPRKGHDVLLRALARLFDLDWRLTIAGGDRLDPVTAHGLRALPEQLGIAERVRFCGEMHGEALANLWREADLFALATRYEGYGMVIAEALKRGLPVAVGNGGAAAALLTPECGVACPVGDVDQMSKALRRMIFDETLRRSMADAAFAIGSTLPDWPEQAQKFAAILAQAARNN